MDIVDIYRVPALVARIENLNTKFMQTLEKDVYAELKAVAKERGVTVQELLRAVVVPDWMQNNDGKQSGTRFRHKTR